MPAGLTKAGSQLGSSVILCSEAAWLAFGAQGSTDSHPTRPGCALVRMNDSCNVARRKRASLLGRSLGGVAGMSPSEFGLALAMFEVRPYSTSIFASSSSVPSADLVLYETERASRGGGSLTFGGCRESASADTVAPYQGHLQSYGRRM